METRHAHCAPMLTYRIYKIEGNWFNIKKKFDRNIKKCRGKGGEDCE